jgi:hypothetical protein
VVRNSRYIVRYQPRQTPLFIDEESKPVGSNGWLSLLGARHQARRREVIQVAACQSNLGRATGWALSICCCSSIAASDVLGATLHKPSPVRTISLMDAYLNGRNSRAVKSSSVPPRISSDDAPTLRSNMPPINLFCGPPAHATKWTLVVDRPREARALTLFDTQAEVHAEIIRLRERGVAHVFALAPVPRCGDRPAVATAMVGTPRSD